MLNLDPKMATLLQHEILITSNLEPSDRLVVAPLTRALPLK
jgi:hypothetical protein